jgi:hypothetical protein
MRKFPDEEIIKKAISQITEEADLTKDPVDVTVDFKDEHEVTHSYVVSFKKGPESDMKNWVPIDISEVSSL